MVQQFVIFQVCGPQDLSGEMLERIALRAVQTGESIHNEPFEVTPARVVDAILMADQLGRSWQEGGKKTGRKTAL